MSNVNLSAIPDDTASDFSRFSRPILTFAATATVIIMLTGIFGNLLTIVALLKCSKVRKNVTSYFIISLCVADFLFCMLVLPFMAIRYIKGSWTHGEGFFCTFIPFVQYGNVGVSLLCIGMITVQRYIMIAHHSYYAKVYKPNWKLHVMIAFCWLFSYGFQLPTLFKVWGQFGYDPKLETCSILANADGTSSKTALFVIAFVIPCLIIIICYTRIFWVVHKSQQRLRQHNESQKAVQGSTNQISAQLTSVNQNNNNNNLITADSAPVNKADAKQKRDEWRITKMVLTIFLSFVACYLPITIIKVADKNVNHPGVHIFGYLMLYLSACINPIIYVIMNKQYRQAYKNVLMCKAPRFLSTLAPGANSHDEKSKNFVSMFSNTHSITMVSQVSIADIQELRSPI